MRRRELIQFGASAAVGWPLAASAQSVKTARIGILSTGADTREAFRQGLSELGHVEGQNTVIEYRSADGRIDRLPELARELVGLKVDVIIAGATPAGLAAKQATATVPIVVFAMGDPVGDGLVSSLARPGGNVTGTTFLGVELVPKRLALLRELLPNMSRLAVLWHPGAFGEHAMSEMLKAAADAAGALGVQLQFTEARNPDELDQAFATIASAHADALFQFPSAMFFSTRGRMVEFAAVHRLPAMFNAREFVELGGLIAYGANLVDLSKRALSYVDKILKGAQPSDLPVQQPTKFELVINLKTAKALGLTVTQSLLARADEVIE